MDFCSSNVIFFLSYEIFYRVLINKNCNNVIFCDLLYCFDVFNFGYKEINDFL